MAWLWVAFCCCASVHDIVCCCMKACAVDGNGCVSDGLSTMCISRHCTPAGQRPVFANALQIRA
eukprot:124003-Chlamydomonas_euryale.AAC.4